MNIKENLPIETRNYLYIRKNILLQYLNRQTGNNVEMRKKSIVCWSVTKYYWSVTRSCLLLWPHEAQHTGHPCPSLSPGVFLKFMSIELVMLFNHLILCHPLLLFSSMFPSIRVFFNESTLHIRLPSIGASASVLPMNIQGWFPLGLTSIISLLSTGLSRVFSSTTIWRHQLFITQPSLWSSSHIRTWLLEKP